MTATRLRPSLLPAIRRAPPSLWALGPLLLLALLATPCGVGLPLAASVSAALLRRALRTVGAEPPDPSSRTTWRAAFATVPLLLATGATTLLGALGLEPLWPSVTPTWLPGVLVGLAAGIGAALPAVLWPAAALYGHRGLGAIAIASAVLHCAGPLRLALGLLTTLAPGLVLAAAATHPALAHPPALRGSVWIVSYVTLSASLSVMHVLLARAWVAGCTTDPFVAATLPTHARKHADPTPTSPDVHPPVHASASSLGPSPPPTPSPSPSESPSPSSRPRCDSSARSDRLSAAVRTGPLAVVLFALCVPLLALMRPARPAAGPGPSGALLVALDVGATSAPLRPIPFTTLVLRASSHAAHVESADGGGFGEVPLRAYGPVRRAVVLRTDDRFVLRIEQAAGTSHVAFRADGVRLDDDLGHRLRDRHPPAAIGLLLLVAPLASHAVSGGLRRVGSGRSEGIHRPMAWTLALCALAAALVG
ncbi:MAG: hypothetical protein RMK74_02505 [Myxococcales bacterium]|nr:hypothetical protein [Myxococcales bacterium]